MRLADTIWPENSAYVGVVATYTLFDSFKRQRAIKEAAAQAEAADLGVELARQMLSPTGAGVTLVSDRSDTESRREL